MDISEFVKNGDQYFLPNLSIDLVIIGYSDAKLKCLLLKIGMKWLLPGGYVQRNESVEDAAQRILKSRAGLEDTFLKFLAVFGSEDRQFKSFLEQFAINEHIHLDQKSWLTDRFVSLTYYALVNYEEIFPTTGDFDEAFGWFDFKNLPEMWMDHNTIVNTARIQLITDIQHEYHAHNLLSESFTMPELHKLYETILGDRIDRSRFQKKMLSTGLYKRLPKLNKNTPGRKPYQYRAKK